MPTSFISSAQVLSTSILVYAVYLVGLVIYRLFLHPLARFPGPKYAAISRWHEFYFDVVKNGRFTFAIEDWHKQYGAYDLHNIQHPSSTDAVSGPIIRIAPDEIHIQDSQFYDTIYTKAGRVDKYDYMKPRFSCDSSAFTTGPADLHAIRRGPLNNLFSRARIVQLESVVREKVNILLKHIREYERTGKPFILSRGYMALAGDLVMRYCFGMDYDHLNSKDFEVTLAEPFMAACKSSPVALQFPIVPRIFETLPESMVEKMEPLFALLFKLKRDLGVQVNAVKSRREIGSDKSMTTVMQAIVDDPDLPEEQKSHTRLNDEAQVLMGAGVTTTGWALSVGSFHIINNPKIYAALRKELSDAIPNPQNIPSWTELERLPYLSGCIREAVRLSYAVTSRNPRLLPNAVTYGDWVIPARTPISMTINDVSNDEAIFPGHEAFKPERWIGHPKTKDGSELDRFFVCFQKGTRACLGIK